MKYGLLLCLVLTVLIQACLTQDPEVPTAAPTAAAGDVTLGLEAAAGAGVGQVTDTALEPVIESEVLKTFNVSTDKLGAVVNETLGHLTGKNDTEDKGGKLSPGGPQNSESGGKAKKSDATGDDNLGKADSQAQSPASSANQAAGSILIPILLFSFILEHSTWIIT